MVLANLERANATIGAIFADLLESWPKNVDLHAQKYLAQSDDEISEEDMEWFTSLVDWLRDEGYLRYESAAMVVSFYMVVLAERGLQTLNAIPSGISGKETFGDKLVEATKDVSKDSAKKVIANLVGQMIGGAIKSLSRG